VRKDQKPGDYKDPGWFKQPAGTQAYEWTGPLPAPARFKAESKGPVTPTTTEVQIRKPTGHSNH
jgi:manganese oxidase